MSDLSDQILLTAAKGGRVSRFKPAVWILIPLAAILFRVYIPLFFESLSYLELPLLVTVYFSLMRREPIAGTLIGACIGLMQDTLSDKPIGMVGIVKTLVGYFAASVSMRFDVDNPAIRVVLGFFFYFFHQFFLWVLARALLSQPVNFDVPQTFLFGLLNAVVALPLFHLLDKLKERN